jgi:hypothetical protein
LNLNDLEIFVTRTNAGPSATLLPLEVARDRHELARRVSLNTFRNWATRGIKTPQGVVRMKATRLGRNLWVTLASVSEFLAAINAGRVYEDRGKGGTPC